MTQSIFRRSLYAVDHHNFYRSVPGNQPEAKLLLQSGRQLGGVTRVPTPAGNGITELQRKSESSLEAGRIHDLTLVDPQKRSSGQFLNGHRSPSYFILSSILNERQLARGIALGPLQLASTFRDDQRIPWHLPGLDMRFELEAIGKQRLFHQ